MTTITKYLALATLAAFLSVGCGKDDADKVAKAAADKAKVAKDAADKATADLADKEKAVKAAKDLADKTTTEADKLKAAADKLKDEAEKMGKEVADVKTKADSELKPIETKIAAMKVDADKATGDAKKDGEAKVAEANGLLGKIKEQLASLGGLKDMASLTALKDKVMGMIADLKKKVGL